MKLNKVLVYLVLLVCFLTYNSNTYAQQFRLVSNGIPIWSTINDSTYSANVNFQSDLTGGSFVAIDLTTDMQVFTVSEQLYRIDSVWNKTFSGASVRVVEMSNTNGTPTGQVMVYDPEGRTTVPAVPFGSTASTAQLQAAVVTWNSKNSSGGTDDQTAAEVPTTSSGNFSSTNVQAGFEEHQADIDQNTSDISTLQSDVSTAQSDITTLQDNQTSGLLGYANKFIMDADAGNPPHKVVARIADDPTASNNGYYVHDSISGVWNKQADLYDNSLELDNTTQAVTGQAVDAWIDSVMYKEMQGVGVPPNTDLVNLYNVATSTPGYVKSDGTLNKNNASFQYTGYIPIPGVDYIKYVGDWGNSSTYAAFYDEEKTFISNVTISGPETEVDSIAVPVDAKFFRASGDVGTPIEVYTYKFSSSVLSDLAILEAESDSIMTQLLPRKAEFEEFDFIGYIPVGTDLAVLPGVDTLDNFYVGNGISSNASYYVVKVPLPGGLDSITYVGNWTIQPTVKCAFYAEDNTTRISSVDGSGSADTTANIQVPEGAYWFWASVQKGGDSLQVLTEDISWQYDSIRNIAQAGIIEEVMDSISQNSAAHYPTVGTDLVNYYSVPLIRDRFISSSGNSSTPSGGGDYGHTDYVPVTGPVEINYIGDLNNPSIYIGFYDKDSIFISNVGDPGAEDNNFNISAPENTRYIRASTRDTLAGVQLILRSRMQISNKPIPQTLESLQDGIDFLASDLGGFADTSQIYGAEPADLLEIYYPEPWTKMVNFTQNYLEKDDDCVVVFQGTSITQGGGYTRTKENPETYPPGCDEYDLPGLAWDYLSQRWPGQQYRRYDSDYFTETGTWNTVTTDTTWDDGHKGRSSRMSLSSSASVEFVIPDSVWAFNFIYRQEKHGDTCTVFVAGGNNLVQVYNDTTQAWEEANGFKFTMELVHDSTARAGLPYGDYSLGYGKTVDNKRLKMRCRNADGTFSSYDQSKTVTITKSSDTEKRLSYWGVEWSPKRYMLSVINAARGSGSYQTDNYQPPHSSYTTSSPFFAVTDIFIYEPDLLCIEVSHNRFGGTPPARVANIQRWYFNQGDSTDLSIAALASDSTDLLFYNASAGTSYREDGFPSGNYWNGKYWTTHDNRDYVAHWFKINKSALPFADSHAAMREAGFEYYNSYQEALTPTSNTGYTLMRDGVHPNERGYKVMWKYIEPWFRF